MAPQYTPSSLNSQWPPGIQSMPVPHVSLSQIRQKPVPQAPPAPKSCNFRYTFHFFLSHPSQKLFLLIALSCASLGQGLFQMKCSGFSYLFQCTCSWLCACLGYCNFLTGFWSCHKGFLNCILSSFCLCGRMKHGTAYSTILVISLYKSFITKEPDLDIREHPVPQL